MASKKAAPKPAAKAPTAPKAPTNAAKAMGTDEQPHTVRVDLGESLPTPPIKTATDNE